MKRNDKGDGFTMSVGSGSSNPCDNCMEKICRPCAKCEQCAKCVRPSCP
jgi:hypothetical protein